MASAITEQKKCWDLLAQKFDRFKNFAPKLLTQHATTCNRVCERMQHVTSNNVGSRWLTMLRPFARDLSYRLQLNLRNGRSEDERLYVSQGKAKF